jgi:hypothetical protein
MWIWVHVFFRKPVVDSSSMISIMLFFSVISNGYFRSRSIKLVDKLFIYGFAVVIAPCAAEPTSVAYFARAPVV